MANPKSESPLATLAKNPPPPDLASMHLPSKETIAAIAREVNFVVPKDVRAQAAELSVAFELATANMVSHHTDGARKAWREHEERMASDVAESRDIIKRDAWSKEDFEEDYRAKFLAFREHAFSLSQQAHKPSLPLAEAFATKARALAATLEASEIETANRFCVRHVPSDAVLAVLKLADHVLKSSKEFVPRSAQSPKSIFAHLHIDRVQ